MEEEFLITTGDRKWVSHPFTWGLPDRGDSTPPFRILRPAASQVTHRRTYCTRLTLAGKQYDIRVSQILRVLAH